MRVRYGFLVLVFVALAACGGGGGGAPGIPTGGSQTQGPTATPTQGATATPTSTSTPVVSGNSAISLDAASAGAVISPDVLGVSTATWFDVTQPYVAQTMQQMGMRLVRFPGGSEADTYHWQSGGSVCAAGGGYVFPASTFDAMMNDVAIPAHTDVAVTLNYGSNAACNAGGDPSEAAAWVAYAKSHGYNVKYWTVGNEVFGGWEYDLHAVAHDPTTYANAVATGYYPQIKAADPNAQVGVVVSDGQFPNWTPTVVTKAKYDFVELHYYAQAPGNESDAYLIGQGVTDFANTLATLRSTMNANGVAPSMPIYVGELNSVYGNPGKQSVSIVNGLFAGMAISEMMKAGVGLATWWIETGGCTGSAGNYSASLYGWQNFGTYNMVSEAANGFDGCPAGTTAGNIYPPGQAYTLLSQFAQAGSAMRAVSVNASVQNVRAYGDTRGTGYGFMLFNLDSANAKTVSVGVLNGSRSSYQATALTYGKAQYDLSQNGSWVGPVTTSLGAVGSTLTVTLPAWSMTLVELQ
jgi:alpha-N-arabinofuranosidase